MKTYNTKLDGIRDEITKFENENFVKINNLYKGSIRVFLECKFCGKECSCGNKKKLRELRDKLIDQPLLVDIFE